MLFLFLSDQCMTGTNSWRNCLCFSFSCRHFDIRGQQNPQVVDPLFCPLPPPRHDDNHWSMVPATYSIQVKPANGNSYRAANHYALGVMYHAQVDCITLLRPWWNHYAKKCKKNQMVIFMLMHVCPGEGESPSATGTFLWLRHSHSAFAF